MSDISEVEKLDDAQLKLTALALGIKPHHRAGRKAILDQIAQQPQYAIDAALKPAIEPIPAPVAEYQSEEAVREELANLLDMDGFRAKFDENTVHFSFQGKVECTTLHQPMKYIKMVAEKIAKRTLVPKMVKDGNDQIWV